MVCALIASGLTLLFSSVTLRRVAPRAFHGPARRDTRVWRSTAFQLTIFSTTMLVIAQVDVVVVGVLLGPEAAASYATASRISKFVPFGLTAINIALAPLAARLLQAGRTDELQRVILRAAAAIFVTTVPLAIGAIVFGRSLLALFGPEFVTGYGALVLLTLGRAANALFGPTAILLTMSGNQRDAMWIAVGSAVLDGSLLLILIPSFGPLGAAAATATTTVAWNIALLITVRRRTGIDPTLFALLRGGRGRPRPSD
jgi:O-antigen/teichoic acid export membrane protein